MSSTLREEVASALTAKLVDLLKQATTERSHFYVASVVRECIAYIALTEADRAACWEKLEEVEK
jgi:hypothetical protein